MVRWMMVIVWGVVAFCQTEQQPVIDEEMQALIEQVEGDEASKNSDQDVEDPHNLTFETDAERALYESASRYLAACASADWQAAYESFWAPYRNAITFGSYIKQEKAAIVRFQIKEVRLLSESCGFVMANYGIENSMMDLGRIPSRQRWILEDGSWRLIADPYANIMGLKVPGAKKIDIPCPYPQRKPQPESKDKKEQPDPDS